MDTPGQARISRSRRSMTTRSSRSTCRRRSAEAGHSWLFWWRKCGCCFAVTARRIRSCSQARHMYRPQTTPESSYCPRARPGSSPAAPPGTSITCLDFRSHALSPMAWDHAGTAGIPTERFRIGPSAAPGHGDVCRARHQSQVPSRAWRSPVVVKFAATAAASPVMPSKSAMTRGPEPARGSGPTCVGASYGVNSQSCPGALR